MHSNNRYGDKSYIYGEIFQTFQLKNISHDDPVSDLSLYNISLQNLENSAKMFMYLTAPPEKYWMQILDVYMNWLYELSVKRILGIFCIFTLLIFHYVIV